MNQSDELLALLPQQVERITASPRFAQAGALSRLLRHLARLAAEEPGAVVTEAQIAREVYGREEPEFNGRTHSAVRVQFSRLRQRLSDYYATYGAEDGLVVELPRGQYQIVVYRRGEAAPAPGEEAPVLPPAPEVPPPRRRDRVRWLPFAAGAAGLLVGALWMAWVRPAPPAVTAPVVSLWQPLLTGGAPMLVVAPEGEAGVLHAVGLFSGLLTRLGAELDLSCVAGCAPGPGPGRAVIRLGLPPKELRALAGLDIRPLEAPHPHAGQMAIVPTRDAPESRAAAAEGNVALIIREGRTLVVTGLTDEATRAAAALLVSGAGAARLLAPGHERFAAVVRAAPEGAPAEVIEVRPLPR